MEGIDKLLDKLGLYNLIGVLLPGIVAVCFSDVVIKVLLNTSIEQYISSDNILIYLSLCYFVGIILQELGSLLMQSFFKGNKLLEKSLKPGKNRAVSLGVDEKEMIEEIVSSKVAKSNGDWSMIYDFCRYSGGDSSLSDREQSIAAMSRSMGIYFALLAAVVAAFCFQGLKNLYISAAFLLVSALMLYRSYRFYKLRYVHILRRFLYTNVEMNSTLPDSK